MTDNIVSFTQAKKRASYAKKELTASENREKFGRNKSEKCLDAFEEDKLAKHLDDHDLSDA